MVMITPHDAAASPLHPGAGNGAPRPFPEIVSSLDETIHAVDLLYRCALIQGGGEAVHLLTEASQGLHRAAIAFRELSMVLSSPADRSAAAEPAGWSERR